MEVTVRGRLDRLVALTLAIVAFVAVGSAVVAQEPRPAAKTPTVLFLCPHGAAKSVLASEYFRRAAKERGLDVRVESAGTEPDPDIAPVVAGHLKKNGYEVPPAKPRRVTESDLATADVVISIGCSLEHLPAPRGSLRKWDDVPSPSEDFAGADRRLRERVMELVEELVRTQGK